MDDGLHRRILASESQDGEIVVKRSVLNESVGIHSHDFFELVYCESGHVIHEINGEKIEFVPDTFLLLSPMDFHREDVITRAETIQIHFAPMLLQPEYASRFLKMDSAHLYCFDARTTRQLSSLMHILLEEFEGDKWGRDECVLALFRCLMLLFFRNAVFEDEHSFVEPPIQKALIYIHTHFRENPSLDAAAEAASMSSSYFCEKFRTSTGEGYCSYLNRLKISYAKRLLTSTNLTITDICFRCGFNSPSNFLRVFHETVHTAPSRYRKEKRKIG